MINKGLVSKNSSENHCYALEGEKLVVAPSNFQRPKWLKGDEWFFVGLKSFSPSRYAWVAQVGKAITVEHLLGKILKSFDENIVREFPLNDYRNMIEKSLADIEKVKIGVPRAKNFRCIGYFSMSCKLEI